MSGRPGRGERGFSLLEFLVVTVVLALMASFIVPLAVERVRMARVRTVVNQFSLDLRAARWAAVSTRKTVELSVVVHPGDTYEYVDSHGRTRQVVLPEGVRIVSSTTPVQFLSNGSVAGGSTTVFETDLTDDLKSRWTISTNLLGVPSTSHSQVGS